MRSSEGHGSTRGDEGSPASLEDAGVGELAAASAGEAASDLMSWDDEAETTLAALVRMVPETLRDLAEGATREESEDAARARGAESVSAEDVIRAWIRTTPPEQRDGLVAVIESLGFEPELYAEELGSVEGWEETED